MRRKLFGRKIAIIEPLADDQKLVVTEWRETVHSTSVPPSLVFRARFTLVKPLDAFRNRYQLIPQPLAFGNVALFLLILGYHLGDAREADEDFRHLVFSD